MPQPRSKPLIVAWRGNRSVVYATSYEARSFGVHSAMPAIRAERLCPDAIFVPPDFTRYRAVSHNVKRWRSTGMALRWTAPAMLEAKRGFRRLKAHKQLAALRIALKVHYEKSLSNHELAQKAKAAGARLWQRPLHHFQQSLGHFRAD